MPDEKLEQALDVMVGMVYAPAFAELDSEREVVLEEIAMVDDNPQDLVHDVIAEAVFGGHPLGRPVIGRAEVISTVSRRALAAHHRAAYASDNVVVAVAGNVTHERAHELLAARLPGSSSPGRRTRKAFTRAPAPGLRFLRKPTEQYHVCLGAPGISRRDDRRFAASLLDAIVGGSASSRLFQEIREKRGMAYSVYSFGAQYSDGGQLGLYVGTREENLVECMEIVARELSDVSAGNVRPGELERAKENLKGRMLLSMESTVEPDEQARQVAHHRTPSCSRSTSSSSGSTRSPATRSRRSQATSSGSTGSPRPASGRARPGSAQPCSASTRAWSAGPRHEGHRLRQTREGRLGARARRSRRRATSSSRRRARPRRPSTSRDRRRSRGTSRWRWRTVSRS